jgi:hypothetical protein
VLATTSSAVVPAPTLVVSQIVPAPLFIALDPHLQKSAWAATLIMYRPRLS